MSTGKINVKTENIFPVIKKFLYSDQEIFLRELISNAIDASQKMKTLVSLGKSNADLGDMTIDVKVDKDAKTLLFADQLFKSQPPANVKWVKFLQGRNRPISLFCTFILLLV